MRLRLFFSVFFLLFLCSPVWTQRHSVQQSGDVAQPENADDEGRARIMHEMEKKAAKERVAALKKDTDKLLELSTELKSYVDKTDEHVLSVDVIKKAEAIEKLAKSVKDKMKGPN